MIEVLIALQNLEWIAKDAHYRTHDEMFYALHLLADKADLGSSVDDLKEAYYLGFKNETPPSGALIGSLAASRSVDIKAVSNKELIANISKCCDTALYAIEGVKKEEGLFGGIHSILDGISEKLLVLKGLCFRTLV